MTQLILVQTHNYCWWYRYPLSGGTGVTYTAGNRVIDIGQDVATTADVTFNDAQFDGDVTVEGDLTVKGTTTALTQTKLTLVTT